jgi:hypothetical protein
MSGFLVLEIAEALALVLKMHLLLLTLLLCSCSPKPADGNVLPRYSDMGAASDAGAVSSGNVK